MTHPTPEGDPSQTPFEHNYQLAPLGNDFEARAERAEAIASVLLNELGALNSALPISVITMRGVRRVTQHTLDTYRDPKTVEERQRWQQAEIDGELSDY